MTKKEIHTLSDAELVKKAIEDGHFKNFFEMARYFYKDPSQFNRIKTGEQTIESRQIREELEFVVAKAIPDGLGDGKCLECRQKVEANEYGYYGNRITRFYCRKHLHEYYAKQQMW